MRITSTILAILVLSACTWGGDDDSRNYDCSNRGQKAFVLDAMRYWYLWNDQLPANVDRGDFASPEALLAYLTTFSPDDGSGNPIDVYSYIGSAAADEEFFGEGRYFGFGFSWRFVAENDARISRVFEGSPAAGSGLARGQQIVALDGRTIAEIEAAEGLDVVLNADALDFTMRETDGVTEFTIEIGKDIVTIDPVPQYRIIDAGGGRMVGYLELATFVGTADAEMDAAFADFRASNVQELIVDLRYNSGGLVSTAEMLGDLLGGDVAENLVFSETRFNDDRAAEFDRLELFDRLANSISLSRLVVIATSATASASELVTNSMEPHVEVTIVGADTFGKPVGQAGVTFCGNILRATAFQTVNADGNGDYFGGLPADCAADDDLNVPVGDESDPNMIAALGFLETGACPLMALPVDQAKPAAAVPPRQPGRRGPAWREYGNAW